VIVDRQKKETTYTGLYYYLAHFSKFVRPGAVRVGTTGSVSGVRCLAFQAKDGGMVAEVMNGRKQAATVHLNWHGQEMSLHLPALSITTYLWK